MNDSTSQTPLSEDNKLGLLDKILINEYEAKGIAAAELYVFGLDSEISFSTQLICKIHHIAFGELYDWAGKWRTISVSVGQLTPPEPAQVIQLMYQFVENLNFKVENSTTWQDQVDCLSFAHYEFIRIHPFNNGNGRTGRIIMNLVALKFGYKPLELYHREGDSRKIYIDAMKSADKGNFEPLMTLIGKEMIAF